MTRPVAGPLESASALTRLLEAEVRLEAMLEETRRLAAASVAEAEARATALSRAVEDEVAEAEASSARLLSEAASARFRELALGQEADLARLDRNGSARVDALATWVSEQVLAAITDRGRTP
jgi:hypothetical protein